LTAEEKLRLEQMIESLKMEYRRLQQKPEYEAAPPKTVMLPLSDGVSLYTVLRTPAGMGPFPTIIMRSCYSDQLPLYELHAQEFCKRGFAFVYQFCRGKGGSGGEWVPNIHERQDGKETLDWLSKQAWVENIGYWGCSYLALTGWLVADIVPEKVKTLYLTHYGTDRFTSAYQCGLFRQDVLTAWTMGNAGYPICADYLKSLKFRPQLEVDEKLWGEKIDWYRDWITNTNRDDAYWNQGFWSKLKEISSKVKVPVYIGEGWYDHHLSSALRTYEALSTESKAHSMLRIGAWNHNFDPCVQGTKCTNLKNSDTQSAYEWFDALLRQKKLPQGKVCFYEIGSDRWLEKSTFPFIPIKQCEFFLSTKKKFEKAYSLVTVSDGKTSSLTYDYNPDNPVMSHGCESLLATLSKNGSLLQPECGWRQDVISFLSDPVPGSLDILGKIQIRLFVSSTADDTAFTTKLMEVYPDGRAYNIRSGITTLAYRKGSDSPRMLYSPGLVEEAVIDLWDVSWRLHKNSRLRIDISSSDFPQYAVHTNYAGVWAKQAEVRIAQQTVYTGGVYPSKIILPLSNGSN
jgi:putative CocE/NonD family hydrolase